MLDLLGVWEVGWDKAGTEPAVCHIFFYGNGNADHHLGIDILYITESYQRL
jgi:hypothetical protein